MRVNVKMLEHPRLELDIPDETTAFQLRRIIEERTTIPFERQRLIFQGKPLVSDGLLTSFGIQDGFTLHLVERPRLDPSSDVASSADDQSSHSLPNPDSPQSQTSDVSASSHIFVDFHVNRTTNFESMERNVELAREVASNVLANFPSSISSSIEILEDVPNEGSGFICICLYGNGKHELDSPARARMVHVIDLLYRTEESLDLIEHMHDRMSQFTPDPGSIDDDLIKLGEILTQLEEISKLPRSRCIENFLSIHRLDLGGEITATDEVSSDRGIVLRHVLGSTYTSILQIFGEIQAEASVIMSKFEEMALETENFLGLLKYFFIGMQEHVQRNMTRISQALMLLADISFDTSKSNLRNANLLTNSSSTLVESPNLLHPCQANILIAFEPVSEGRSNSNPTLATFEILTRSANCRSTLSPELLSRVRNRRDQRYGISAFTAFVPSESNNRSAATDQVQNSAQDLINQSASHLQTTLPYIFTNPAGMQMHGTVYTSPSSQTPGLTQSSRTDRSVTYRNPFRLASRGSMTSSIHLIPPSMQAGNITPVARGQIYLMNLPMPSRFTRSAEERGPSGSQGNQQTPRTVPVEQFFRETSIVRQQRQMNSEYQFVINLIIRAIGRTIESTSNIGTEAFDGVETHHLAELRTSLERIRGSASDTSSEAAVQQRFASHLENLLRRIISMMATNDPSIAQELSSFTGEFEQLDNILQPVQDGIAVPEPIDVEIEAVTVTNEDITLQDDTVNRFGSERESSEQQRSQTVQPETEAGVVDATRSGQPESKSPANISAPSDSAQIRSASTSVTTSVSTSEVSTSSKTRKRVAEELVQNESDEDSWKSVLPRDWVAAIEDDKNKMSAEHETRGLSDVYLLGSQMKKKKNDVIRSNQSQDNVLLRTVDQALQETCKFSDITVSEISLQNIAPETIEVFETSFDHLLAERLYSDSDFEFEKFPELHSLLLRRTNR